MAQEPIRFVHNVISLSGQVLEMEFADVDGDELKDVLVAMQLPSGRREIHIFKTRPSGSLPATPDTILDIKSDIVLWGVGEFRPQEAGRELFFASRSAAYTFSPRQSTYSGNIKKVVAADMLLDLADDRILPLWSAIGDIDADGVDDIVLATRSGFLLVRVDGTILGQISLRGQRGQRLAMEFDFVVKFGSGIQGQPMEDLFIPEDNPGALREPPMFFAEESLPVPMLRDANGDGYLDLFYFDNGYVSWHVYQEIEGEDLRFDPLHAGRMPLADDEDWDLWSIDLESLGQTDATDLVVVRIENTTNYLFDWQVLVYHDPFLNPERVRPPVGVFKVEATVIEPYLVQLRRNEPPSLAISAWSLDVPTIFGGKVTIEHDVSLYPVKENLTYAKSAASTYHRGYPADDFTPFRNVPALARDLDGDGITDLLEPDLSGVLEILPVKRNRKSKVEFAERPVRRIEVNALDAEVEVMDLNGDQIGDVLVSSQDPPQMEVYLSRRR